MWATKSALTLGMHHCFFCHDLMVFFQVQPHRLVRQGLNHPQLNHPVRQQAQVPVVVALRGRAAGQGNQLALCPVIHLAVPVGLGPVIEHTVQSALSEAPLDVEHRALGHIQGSGHLGRRPALVSLEQDAGPVDNPRAEPFPARTMCSNWLRSSGISRTANFSLTTPPRNSTYCQQISTPTRSPASTPRPSLIEY